MNHTCQSASPEHLVAFGPLVEVTLLPHHTIRDAFVAAGNMPSMVIKMMVDTGAQRTVVEQRVADAMGLSPINFVPITGVSQEAEQCPVYLMTVRIGVQDDRKAGFVDFSAEVVGTKSPRDPMLHAGLIGRDFLRKIHLVYNGPKGQAVLHMSSEITGKASSRPTHPKKRRRR